MAKKKYDNGGNVNADGDVKLNKPIQYHANKLPPQGDVKLNTPLEYHANTPSDDGDVQLNTPLEYHANQLNDSVVKKSGGRVKKKKFNRGGKAKKEIKVDGEKVRSHMGKPARKSKH